MFHIHPTTSEILTIRHNRFTPAIMLVSGPEPSAANCFFPARQTLNIVGHRMQELRLLDPAAFRVPAVLGFAFSDPAFDTHPTSASLAHFLFVPLLLFFSSPIRTSVSSKSLHPHSSSHLAASAPERHILCSSCLLSILSPSQLFKHCTKDHYFHCTTIESSFKNVISGFSLYTRLVNCLWVSLAGSSVPRHHHLDHISLAL